MLSTFAVSELTASSSVNKPTNGDEVKISHISTPSPVTSTDQAPPPLFFPFNLFPIKRDSNDEDGDKSDAELQPKPAKRRRKPDCKLKLMTF